MNNRTALQLLSFLAGTGLGWIHFRVYRHMLEAMMAKPETKGFRRYAVIGGLFRHVLSLAAGICMVRGAGLDPLALCGGLLLATVLYRVYVIRLRPSQGVLQK